MATTENLINILNRLSCEVETNDGADNEYLREAAERLDKLEKELEDMRGKQKTLRDEFAMQALNGLIGQCKTVDDFQRVSNVSYLFADAMMKERTK